jgi:hypothetical protein
MRNGGGRPALLWLTDLEQCTSELCFNLGPKRHWGIRVKQRETTLAQLHDLLVRRRVANALDDDRGPADNLCSAGAFTFISCALT